MRREVARTALAVVSALLLRADLAPADLGDCGQPQSTGTAPKTSDALAALRTAVGNPSACDGEPCVCDVNSSGGVNTSDALAILRAAVGQNVALSCDCGCTALGDASLSAAGDAVLLGSAPAQQILVEVKLVEVTLAAADELGFDWLSTTATISPEPGGTSGYDTNVAVSSNATGGPSNIPYFLYKEHRAEGALPILNKNFVSPFTSIKTLFELPTMGCVTFPEDSLSTLQNHPGGSPVENVPAGDGGYDDVESVAHSFLTSQQVSTLLTSLQMKAGTEVFTAPTVRAYPGQSIFHMIDDVEPDIDDFETAFKTRIQSVTMMPFGNFTGPVLDLEPSISGDDVLIRMRLGTELATFFFSTAFQVDGMQTDAEIPLHRRSTTTTSIIVEAGQTVLIGGLKRASSQSVEKGLPFIGDIPLVGGLFTRKRLDPANRLVVFVTPTIISAPEP
jgi:type II secretory pathway component GspD/PulD (secretin)